MLPLQLLALLLSVAAAFCFGALWGRRHERRVLLGPVLPGSGERRIGDYEDQLRRSVGAARMHPDPENAAHIRRIQVRR
jgi:hypothetical protein